MTPEEKKDVPIFSHNDIARHLRQLNEFSNKNSLIKSIENFCKNLGYESKEKMQNL